MAAFPKFSFSGWNSQSLAPKVNPATALPPGVTSFNNGGLEGNTLKPPPGAAAPTSTELVATTNAANPNLPAWLQTEVDRLNAQDALRKAALGGGNGGVAAPPAFDPQIGAAALTDARARYNAQVNQMNEQARLANLIQRRNLMNPVNAFGFNNPMDVGRQISLDREIEAYQNVNLPIAGRSVSGWVGGPRYSNGLLNGTGFA